MERAEFERLAGCALEAVETRWPHKLDHMILDSGDRPPPEAIHPVFFGCYDWHSSVHMHWSLLRLRSICGDGPLRERIERHFDARFTKEAIQRERAYAAHPRRGAFERPYGWAWLLKLQEELEADGSRWAPLLRPFAREVAARLVDFLRRTPYAVRAGAHANSAFAMILARDYALRCDDGALRGVIDAQATAWFAHDAAYPWAYEPGGADFLSPGLCEALLMSRVLGDSFPEWWRRFLGDEAAFVQRMQPVTVTDAVDPQLVHLAGLNLSRAWSLSALSRGVAGSEGASLEDAARAHRAASRRYVTEGDFVATHWLTTFALLAEG